MTDYIKSKENPSFFERPISVTFIIDALILLYVVSVYIFSYGEENVISKGIALLLMGVLAVYVLITKSVVINKLTIFMGGFTFFCFLSSFWAIDSDLAISKGITMLQLFALVFLLYNYLLRENKLNFLITALCIAGTVYAVYTIFYFGIEEYFAGLEEGERMGSEIANVNTIGMATAAAALISLWHVFYNKKYWYLVLTVICGTVALGSGSRKGLIMLIMGIFLLFVLKGNSKKKITSILQGVLILAALFLVLQLPIFETITYRMEGVINFLTGEGSVDHSTMVRSKMISYGWEQFLATPFTGIGIGNSGYVTTKVISNFTYLHNNYIELLASVGIFGTLIYYGMYLAPMPQIIKLAFKQNKYAILGLVMLIIQLVMHYAAVQYYSKPSYLYIILFSLIIDSERKKNINA